MRRVRFMSIVGSVADRLSMKIWPGFWVDATGFGRSTTPQYTLGYHTGADLNLNVPVWNADRGMPFYAMWRGTVRSVTLGPGTWGWLICIEHELIDGKVYWTRYAHGTNIQVKVGDIVDQWTILGYISNAEGAFGDHMHFDILDHDPFQCWHWPGWNLQWFEGPSMLYIEPKAFLQIDHFVEGEDDDVPDNMIVTAVDGLEIFEALPLENGTAVMAGERVVLGSTVYRSVTFAGETFWVKESDPKGRYLSLPSEVKVGYGNAFNGVNVRTGTGTNFPILLKQDGTNVEIAFNEKIEYTETGIVATGYTWLKLVGRAGYVASALIRPN